MSIVARFTPANLTTEKYEAINRRLEEAGVWPDPDGLEVHVCFGSDPTLRVSEIWASREQMDAFGETLMPILGDAGIEMESEPEVFEAHNLIKH